MYQAGIQRQFFGYASAVAMSLFALILVMTFVMRRFVRER